MASVKEKAKRVRHPTCEKDPGPEDEGPNLPGLWSIPHVM